MHRPNIVAIVWAPHEARTAAYADWLEAELHNVHFLKERTPWLAPLKYIPQWFVTWKILWARRPRFVYVTNSPPVAGLCVMVFCWFSSTRFILDTHPPSLFGRKWAWSRPVQRFTSRFAAVNIVDQERFADLFRGWGSRVLVLTNPPRKVLPPRPASGLPDRPTISYVGTFGDDEPIDELLEAARLLPEVDFFVLGNTSLAGPGRLDNLPSNVVLTGYLLRQEYWDRLYLSYAIVVLTTHPHSLLGGAQDGLHIDTPLVLSDQPTLREYFTKGAIFAANNGVALAAAVEEAIGRNVELRREIAELHNSRAQIWRQNFLALRELVQADSTTLEPTTDD